MTTPDCCVDNNDVQLISDIHVVETLQDLKASVAEHLQVLRDGRRLGGAVAPQVQPHQLHVLRVGRVPTRQQHVLVVASGDRHVV